LVLVSLEKGKSEHQEEDTKNGLLCCALRTLYLYTKDGSKRKKCQSKLLEEKHPRFDGLAERNDVKCE